MECPRGVAMNGLRFFRTREAAFPGWDLGPGIPRVVSYHIEARAEGNICHQRHVWTRDDGSVDVEQWIPTRAGFWRQDDEVPADHLAGGIA